MYVAQYQQLNGINITYLEPTPAVFTVEVKEWEIDHVVSFARKGESYYFVSMVLESAPINEAIRRGLVVCDEDGFLSVPSAVAPAVPIVPVEENVENHAEQYVKTNTDQINQQIETAQASQDPAIRLHGQMLEDCTKGDWLDQLVAEIQAEPDQEEDLTVLSIPGMKLQNANRDNNYWFFTGTKQAAIAAVGWLKDLGIPSTAKPNGSTGNYMLIAPRYTIGQLIPGQQSYQEAA